MSNKVLASVLVRTFAGAGLAIKVHRGVLQTNEQLG